MGVFRQFPYSNFHEMNMDEIIKIIKNMLEEWATYHAEWDAWMEEINEDWSEYQRVMDEAWENMKSFINNYFDNLDVQVEINNKITSMVNSGEFGDIVAPYIPPRVTEWLSANITQPVGVVIDTSLTVTGACADAKATGDRLDYLEQEFIFNGIDNALIENIIMSDHGGDWVALSGYTFGLYQIEPDSSIIIKSNAVNNSMYCFLTSPYVEINSTPDYATGESRTELPANDTYELTAPNDAYYLYIAFGTSGTDRTPISVKVNEYEILNNIPNNFRVIQSNIETVNETAEDTKENFDRALYSNVNILEYGNKENGYFWGDADQKLTSEGTWAFDPIPIKQGFTYYFKNIYGYYCFIKDSDGVSTRLTTNTNSRYDGTFTALTDGYLYITIGNSALVDGVILLTTSQELYYSGTYNTYYKPNRLTIDGVGQVYYVKKDGTGDFDSLVDAITEAIKHKDSIVYVGDGTWDIIDELGAAYIDSVSQAQRGLYLQNGIHLIFSSKALITCNYTGTRSDTILWLAAFNAGVGGFTLENAHIVTKNIRYAIHDERDSDTDFYQNTYKNCVISHDNTLITGATEQGYPQCIGGGLGVNGLVNIESCIFSNENTGASGTLVSYHNSAGTGRSNISIRDCYFKGNGRVKISWYGSSTDETPVIVTNNSFGQDIVFQAETVESVNENMELLAWNNIIRP